MSGESTFHLVKIPFLADGLAEVARRRGIMLRELDSGHLIHCVLRELWQEHAPAPFVLRGQGRFVDVWGYTRVDAITLMAHAQEFGDPFLLKAIDNLNNMASRPVPYFPLGKRVGFHLRACPVVRLAKQRHGHEAGAEIDAFLARCFQVDDQVPVSREEVYRDWLIARLGEASQCGVKVERVGVSAFVREKMVRRDHQPVRQAKTLERPDVCFEGELTVTDGAKFHQLLQKGVGRHRAFGYGALMVVAPGTSYPRI